jgi:hypothetical protein
MILKLVVRQRGSEQSKQLLNYIEEVLRDLNSVGIKIHVIGIRHKDIKQLTKNGIKYVPALIIGDGGRKIYKKTPILNEIAKIYKSLKNASRQTHNPYSGMPDSTGDLVKDYLVAESQVEADEEDDEKIIEEQKKQRLKEYNAMRNQSKQQSVGSLNSQKMQQYRNNVDTHAQQDIHHDFPEADNEGDLDLASFKMNATDQDDIMMASFIENHV